VVAKQQAAASKEQNALEQQQQQHASAGDEFSALVSQLESQAAKRLNGPGRSSCLRAFTDNPDGFARCVEEALARGRHSPLGLLVRMVRDGDHQLSAPEAVLARESREDRDRARLEELHAEGNLTEAELVELLEQSS
jgi:hypothetical protein